MVCVLLVSLSQTAVANDFLPWRMGVAPGVRVEIPQVKSVQGHFITAGRPSVVAFAMVAGGESQEAFCRVAEAWQRRHPKLQVVVVDTRSRDAEIAEFVGSRQVTVPVVSDTNDIWEDAFDTNRVPIVYLVDSDGVIREKVSGFDPSRYVHFDRVLSWAEQGEWGKVEAQRSRPLKVGEAPAPLSGVSITQGHPTIVLQTDPLCIHCESLVQEGIQDAINALGRKYPVARFIILERAYSPHQIIQALREFAAIHGMAAVPRSTAALLDDGPVEWPQPQGFPRDGWVSNVHFVRYEPGGDGDPEKVWGQPLTPMLFLFGADGLLRSSPGPESGALTVGAIEETVEFFLRG